MSYSTGFFLNIKGLVPGGTKRKKIWVKCKPHQMNAFHFFLCQFSFHVRVKTVENAANAEEVMFW